MAEGTSNDTLRQPSRPRLRITSQPLQSQVPHTPSYVTKSPNTATWRLDSIMPEAHAHPDIVIFRKVVKVKILGR
jgi:hypothetical protein